MTVRMKDIAKDLGISKVTVSKVLNNHLDISPATRERVLQRVRELNYQPSLQARSLFTGQSLTCRPDCAGSRARILFWKLQRACRAY